MGKQPADPLEFMTPAERDEFGLHVALACFCDQASELAVLSERCAQQQPSSHASRELLRLTRRLRRRMQRTWRKIMIRQFARELNNTPEAAGVFRQVTGILWGREAERYERSHKELRGLRGEIEHSFFGDGENVARLLHKNQKTGAISPPSSAAPPPSWLRSFNPSEVEARMAFELLLNRIEEPLTRALVQRVIADRYTIAEAARTLGISPAAARKRLSRLRFSAPRKKS